MKERMTRNESSPFAVTEQMTSALSQHNDVLRSENRFFAVEANLPNRKMKTTKKIIRISVYFAVTNGGNCSDVPPIRQIQNGKHQTTEGTLRYITKKNKNIDQSINHKSHLQRTIEILFSPLTYSITTKASTKHTPCRRPGILQAMRILREPCPAQLLLLPVELPRCRMPTF